MPSGRAKKGGDQAGATVILSSQSPAAWPGGHVAQPTLLGTDHFAASGISQRQTELSWEEF